MFSRKRQKEFVREREKGVERWLQKLNYVPERNSARYDVKRRRRVCQTRDDSPFAFQSPFNVCFALHVRLRFREHSWFHRDIKKMITAYIYLGHVLEWTKVKKARWKFMRLYRKIFRATNYVVSTLSNEINTISVSRYDTTVCIRFSLCGFARNESSLPLREIRVWDDISGKSDTISIWSRSTQIFLQLFLVIIVSWISRDILNWN